MWLFLGSECLFFGSFISAYLLYRNRSISGPYPEDLFDIPFTSVSSFVLLMSSVSMVLALAAIQKGDVRRMRIWLLTTSLLGVVFLGGQAFEFTEFYREGLTLDTNMFGTTFFVLTGFHGAHVTVGVLILLSMWARVVQGEDHAGEQPQRRARGAVLALRRYRVDYHLHDDLPGAAELGAEMFFEDPALLVGLPLLAFGVGRSCLWPSERS